MKALTHLSDAEAFRRACDAARMGGRRVGLVPTMGALHAGHLALVRAVRTTSDLVAVSIFVNPTQFGPNEDFARYPRDVEGDLAKLESVGVDLVFTPEAGTMYPDGDQTRVRVEDLAMPLCGVYRPGHFEGVATVVAKLFALTGPSTAMFGQKDYQQWLVLRRMARDLFLPVDVQKHPIVREPDGVAMSSRNAYLSDAARVNARALSQGLAAAQRAFAQGERRPDVLRACAWGPVNAVSSAVDYVDLRDADTLHAFSADAPVEDRALLAIACWVDKTRLIDNVVLGEDPPILLDHDPHL